MRLFKTVKAGIDCTGDLTLARRAAAGDASALGTLYERYADPLYAYIVHRLDGSREDAEDVWQETLLAALRSLPGYTGRSRLFTWLCGVASHKIADLLRRRGRNPVQVFADLPPDQLAELADGSPLPEDVLADQATRMMVVEALGVLPEEYRRALVMRHAEEHSVEEVARLLGKSCKATESLLARARKAFRAALVQLDEEVRCE